MHKNILAKSVRLAMIGGAAAAAFASPAVFAADEEGVQVERIEVTGSRIKRTDMETPVPITVLTRADIEATGAINVADVLNRSPVSIAGSDQSNSAFTTSGVGLNTTSLRNLGQERTLILVNGRRFVSGVTPSAGYAVDLNAIPTAMIERIEILKSASSAIYGSDAIAGVVNIITRSDFEGAELDVQAGLAGEGDRETKTITFTSGKSWDDGSAWFSLGYDDDEGIKSTDRSFSEQDLAILLDDNGKEYVGPVNSSYPPQGRVGGYNGDGTEYSGDNSFNRASYRQLVTPLERKYAAFGMKQELSDSVRMFTEVNWNTTKTIGSTIEPTPFHVPNDVWLKTRNGTGGMDINSPLIPDLLRQNLIADGVTNLNQTTFVRRMVEIGARSTDIERTTMRVASGFDWDVNENWANNTYFTWGRTDSLQQNGGQINIERAANALDVMALDGNLVCVNEQARLQGCVPLDLFGENTISAGAAEYVRADAKATGQSEQFVLGSSFTGELPIELADGNIGVAIGVEYREETGSTSPGDLAQSGASSTNQADATYGKLYTRDIYAETILPLADGLALDLAARYSDHSITGGDTTWNAGLEYSPIDELKLRASAAGAIRTPNISDLYGGRGETFATVTDPCKGISATNSADFNANVYANCMAIPEIAQRVSDTGAFTLTQAEAQGTGGTVGGSPDVKPETAETWSLGFVYQAMDNLNFTVDYYNIHIEDAIATTARSTVLRRCFEGGSATFDQTCSGQVERNSVGALTAVDSGTSNENELDVVGVDFEANYSLEVGPGELSAQLVYTYLDEYTQTAIEDGSVQKFAGEITTPRNRANVNLNYTIDDLKISWSTRYWGKVVDSRSGDNFNYTDFDSLTTYNEVDAVFYHDMNLRYNFTNTFEGTFGVRNVFDKTPPMLPQGTSGSTGINTVSEAYDVTGRYFYAGVNVKF
ncbi:TonB-dependent receptor [Shewanella frigidimarina]|uniref:TonB-dependent receptor n=1 Tax=Shewanella frigidimarina TaxID=56812 RepID=A0A106C190_SHEFR|nr:TonB-dependent receptor [Shewanella frigidimarina]KVX02383.1 TonB-dependent receptor [Shewanella frigidimarina]